MSSDDLEEGDGDVTTYCSNRMEGGSTSIIQNLKLLEQAVFIDADKDCYDSYD